MNYSTTLEPCKRQQAKQTWETLSSTCSGAIFLVRCPASCVLSILCPSVTEVRPKFSTQTPVYRAQRNLQHLAKVFNYIRKLQKKICVTAWGSTENWTKLGCAQKLVGVALASLRINWHELMGLNVKRPTTTTILTRELSGTVKKFSTLPAIWQQTLRIRYDLLSLLTLLARQF